MKRLIRFFNDDSGATAVEYAIMAGGIAAVIVASVTALGIATKDLFTFTWP